MKRKGSKKAQKSEDESNGVEDAREENGGASDVEPEDEEEPQEKKRKSSKLSRKNVSFSSKKNENPPIESDPLEDLGDVKKPKEKKRKGKDVKAESSEEDAEDDESQAKETLHKKKKKGKDAKAESSDEDAEDEDDESQYEVEKVLDEKIIKGVRHFLIRWKGYEEESDTWEPEDTVNCPDAIKQYQDVKKKTKGKKEKPVKKEKKHVDPEDSGEWDENEDFEVEKILEVHHRRDGKREFLVSWKGFAAKDNSWEPEENMNCKDLIERFMDKVQQAKTFEDRELRVNRKQVHRFTYNTPDSNRRLSRRMSGKERVQYHDTE